MSWEPRQLPVRFLIQHEENGVIGEGIRWSGETRGFMRIFATAHDEEGFDRIDQISERYPGAYVIAIDQQGATYVMDGPAGRGPITATVEKPPRSPLEEIAAILAGTELTEGEAQALKVRIATRIRPAFPFPLEGADTRIVE